LLSELMCIAQEFAALERVTAPDEQIAALLHYIVRVSHVKPRHWLAFAQAHAGPKLETIMKTTAEQLLERGSQGRDPRAGKDAAQARSEEVQHRPS
jgi:hypothetical protein